MHESQEKVGENKKNGGRGKRLKSQNKFSIMT